MSASSIEGSEAAFKILYPDGVMPDGTISETKLHNEFATSETFRGRQEDRTIKNADAQGIGYRIVDAQAADDDTSYHQYNLKRSKWFAVARVDGEAAEAGVEDGSLVDIVEDKVSGVHNNMVIDHAIADYGNGSGVRAQLKDIGSAPTYELEDDTNMNYLDFGLVVVSVSDDSLATTVTSAAPRKIIGIDRVNRTITLNASLGGTSANGDYLVRSSMEATAGNKYYPGLKSWLDNQGMVNTPAIFGMTRTSDPVVMAGHLKDYTDWDPNDAVLDFCSIIAATGRGDPNKLVTNPITAGIMKRSAVSKVFYTGSDATGMYGFDELAFRTETGPLKMLVDPFAPIGESFVLRTSDWLLRSLRRAPHMRKFKDGFMKVQDEDSIEAQWRTYPALACKIAAANGRMTGHGK